MSGAPPAKRPMAAGDYASLPPNKKHLASWKPSAQLVEAGQAAANGGSSPGTGASTPPVQQPPPLRAASGPARTISATSTSTVSSEPEKIPVQILRHNFKHLRRKFEQRNEDLARKDEERERLEGLFRARLAAANEVAVHWEELEATVVHMLQENGFPPPDVPESRALPSLLALADAEETRQAADTRVQRTKALVLAFVEAAAESKRQRKALLAAVEEGGAAAEGLPDTLKADLEGASAALETERVRCEALEKKNVELEADLARATTLAAAAADERETLAFEAEKCRNHVSSLTVRLEDALAAAATAVAVQPAASSGAPSGGPAAAGGGGASAGGGRAAPPAAAGAAAADPAEIVELRGQLEAATMEIRALERQLVDARQREERARFEASQQVRNTPEYNHLMQTMQEQSEQWNKERMSLKAQASRQMQQMGSDRAEIVELRRLGEERKAQFDQLVTEFRSEMEKSAAEADKLRIELSSKTAGGGGAEAAAEADRMVEAARRELKTLKADNRRLQKIVRERAVADALRFDDRDTTVETLKAETERAIESEKKMKLLLNVYSNIDKDRRDKVALANSLQKVKDELAALKEKVDRGEVGGGQAEAQGARIAALESDLADEKASVETLLHEIEATGASLDEAQEQSMRLMTQLREKEDASFAHVTARMQAEAAAKLALEQRQEDSEARSKLLVELDAKTKLIERLQEVERTGREDAWQQQKRVAEADSRLEIERQQHLAKLALAETASVALHDAKEQNEQLSRRIQEYVAQVTRAESASRRAEADAKTARDQADQMRLMSTGGDSVLQEMIDDLRKSINCSVNTNLPKDTVILTCMHVFSNKCVQDRIRNRQRKCPQCGLGFGANDAKRIYLTT